MALRIATWLTLVLSMPSTAFAQFWVGQYPEDENARTCSFTEAQAAHFATKWRAVRAALPQLPHAKRSVPTNGELTNYNCFEIGGAVFQSHVFSAGYDGARGRMASVDAFLFPGPAGDGLGCDIVRTHPVLILDCSSPGAPGALEFLAIVGASANSDAEFDALRPIRPKSGVIPVQAIGLDIAGDPNLVRRIMRAIDWRRLRALIEAKPSRR